VISYNQGRFHSIVLRVSINSNQFQDVAVRSKAMLLSKIVETKIYTERIMLWSLHTCSFWNSDPAYIGDRTIIVNNNVYGSGIVYVANWPIIGLCSLRHFQFMFLPGIGGIIRYIGIRGDQFYITTIGLIIITIIEVIAIAGRLTYVFLRITLIIWGEGLLHCD
jgi:hypothetical protein